MRALGCSRTLRLFSVALAGLLVAGGVGCDSRADETVLVLAAASLTDVFTEIGPLFTEETGIAVEFSFAGTSTLREQILDGAPADVFAAASPEIMDEVVGADATSGDPTVFATNEMAIAIPPGNPGDVQGIEAFAEDDLFIGLCAPTVPCGSFGLEVLQNAGVNPAPDTEEPDVRALLTKIEAGELDAGFVYTSDLAAAGDSVIGIPIPSDINVVVHYEVAALVDAGSGADSFISFLDREVAVSVLESYGFSIP